MEMRLLSAHRLGVPATWPVRQNGRGDSANGAQLWHSSWRVTHVLPQVGNPLPAAGPGRSRGPFEAAEGLQ